MKQDNDRYIEHGVNQTVDTTDRNFHIIYSILFPCIYISTTVPHDPGDYD